HLGYQTLRSRQEHITTQVLEGKNALGTLRTGSGKSLCYQSPRLMLEHATLVLAPLIPLLQDHAASLKRRRPHAAGRNTTMPTQELETVMAALEEGQLQFL